jgi:effector-binding domain-containing protein
MKTLKVIFLILIILIILLVLISFLLPKSYKVERSISIRADKGVIFNLASHFNKWDLWSVWTKEMDSTVKFELIGTDGQLGAQRKWSGKIMKDGEMKAIEIIPGELFAYTLDMDNGKFRSLGKIRIESKGDSNKVTWSHQGELGYNPVARYMGLFMDKMMAPDFEKGLTKLKKVAEERNSWPAIEEKMMPEQVVVVIRDSAGPATYGQVMGKAFGEVMSFVKSNRLTCISAPFAIYIRWDSVTLNSVMDLGVAVEKAEHGKGRIRVEKIPAEKVVMAHYFGPYDKTASTYYILDKYIKESGMQTSGGPWEIYITDPTTEKDTLKLATDILFPIK